MHYSAAGVRDGIIADLTARGVGRELSMLREQRRVVEQMARRYGVHFHMRVKLRNWRIGCSRRCSRCIGWPLAW